MQGLTKASYQLMLGLLLLLYMGKALRATGPLSARRPLGLLQYDIGALIVRIGFWGPIML